MSTTLPSHYICKFMKKACNINNYRLLFASSSLIYTKIINEELDKATDVFN